MIAIYPLLTLFLSILIPGLGFALEGDVSAIVNNSGAGGLSDVSTIAYSVYDPSLKDISLDLLSKLFGPVSYVLPADHTQLLGFLLNIFNVGIWVVGGAIVSFVVVTTIIHTSKEGELMGQRAHMATLYRAVLGMILLIPKPPAGYTLVQIIVMWVVVQGVNLADNIWTTAVQYLNNGGVVSSNVSPERYKRASPLVTQVLESEVCMYLMQAHDEKLKVTAIDWLASYPQDKTISRQVQSCWAIAPTNYVPNYVNDSKGSLYKISFGKSPASCPPSINTEGVCGIYDWSSKPAANQPYIALAMTQLVTELLPVAYQIAQQAVTSASMEEAAKKLPAGSTPPSTPLPDPCLSTSTNSPPPACWPVPTMQAAAIDYVNTLQPLVSNSNTTSANQRLSQSVDYGWVLAGVYYRDLVQNTGNNNTVFLSDDQLVTMTPTSALPPLVSDQGPPVPNPPRSKLDTSKESHLTSDDASYGVLIKGSKAYLRPMELAFQAIDDPTVKTMDYSKKTAAAFDAMTDAWTASSSSSYAQVNSNIQSNNQWLAGGGSFDTNPFSLDHGSSVFHKTFPNMDWLVAQDVEQMVNRLWTAWQHLTTPSQKFEVRDLIGALSAFGVELMDSTLTFWHDVTGHIWQEVAGIASGYLIAMGAIGLGAGWIQELGDQAIDLFYYILQYLQIVIPVPPIVVIIPGVIFFAPILLGGIILYTIGFTAFQLSAGFVLLFKITITIIFWYLPIFLYVGVPIFTTGVLLGLFAPLIPYLLFLFGVLGWFVAVIESMVAAPLIALGITHPSGQHDYLGRAEQAIMLLLNIMLRPPAMIIGLLAATILAFVSLQLLTLGFSAVFAEGLSHVQSSGVLGAMGIFTVVMAFIIAYTTMALVLINRCFSLIYLMPDKLTRWLGAQPEQSMPDSILEHIKGGMTRSVQSVAGSQAQTDTEMTKAASPSAIGIESKQGPDKNK